MIRGFTCAYTARLFQRQCSRRLLSGIQQRVFETLHAIDAATQPDEPRLPPSNRVEALRGDRAGQWSIRGNDPWRVGFLWDDADAHDVEIVDYHR